MKRPGIKAQEQMVKDALHIHDYLIESGYRPKTYRVIVPSAAGPRYSAASFEVERDGKKTKIRASYGIHVKSVTLHGEECADPVWVYNSFIQLPFLKTTIATAFGFKPIPAPWIK